MKKRQFVYKPIKEYSKIFLVQPSWKLNSILNLVVRQNNVDGP